MRPGDVLEIIGDRGRVVAELVDVRAPAELPDIPEYGVEAGPASAVLQESGVLRVAVIRYEYLPGELLMFVAFELPGGEWFDLQGQRLSIAVLPVEVC